MSKQTDLINIPDAITVDGSNNVGIGTSSPSSLLDVDKSQNSETNIELTNTNTGSAAQVRTKYTTDGGLFTVGKASDAHSFGGDAYIYNVDNTNIRFATSDTERMRILSGGGITFNGDTAAANALNDYEEGTWTPVFISKNGTSPTGTFAHQGRYTKIGRQVHIIAYMQVTTGLSSGSGILVVNGLPFTSIIGDGNHSTGAVTASNWNTSSTDFLAVTQYDSTSIGFLSSNNNGVWSWENTTTLNNSCYIRFSLTYHTTQ